MIELDRLSKRFASAVVVDDVSMTIEPGTITVIVGASGAGKSTLLRMVNRLIEPSAGTVRIDGADTRSLPAHELRRRIGYAIQSHGLFPHRTVAQNIATVPVLLKWDRARIEARVRELLTLFHLDPGQFADRLPHELSGGEQQRVGVARALAASPSLLLMDEPFGALDPIIRAKARDDLKAIQRRFGTTVLLVTHDMDEAIHLGDRIAVMDGGKLLQHAAPADILARPATGFVRELLGIGDQPFRYLSLSCVADAAEPGEADGAAIAATRTQRDALSELLWSGRAAAPVSGDGGAPLGRVTLDALVRRAARPS
jgi:osmoprotectant transport system ATP-binding protein